MQIVYAVRVSVASTKPEEASSFDQVLAHVAQWGQERFGLAVQPSDLLQDGTQSGVTRADGSEATAVTARWTAVSAPSIRGMRFETKQPIQGVEAHFQTTVTVVQDATSTAFRLAMGRSTDSDVLAPSSFSGIYVPRIVKSVVEDKNLTCSAYGVQVDTQYIRAASLEELKFLTLHLDHQHRLPVLLVDTVRAERLHFAKDAARKLAGLAQVVCLGFPHVLREFNDQYPALAVPFAGARLVWPAPARHPLFYEDEMGEKALNQAFKMLSSAAVVTYSVDRDWTQALRAERQHEASMAAATLRGAVEAAKRGGDQSAENDALLQALDSETKRADAAQAELDEFIREYDAGQDLRTKNFLLKQELEAYRLFCASPKSPSTDPLATEAVPMLSSPKSEILDYLSASSEGAIEFTDNALRRWEQCQHPRPEQLREALIRLTRAAVSWRAAGTALGMPLPEWFKIEFELNYAPSDERLRRERLHRFDFQGETYDRLSHLKLDDHVPPNEVGRIYFAIDAERTRFIVDHIGLKLYGI